MDVHHIDVVGVAVVRRLEVRCQRERERTIGGDVELVLVGSADNRERQRFRRQVRVHGRHRQHGRHIFRDVHGIGRRDRRGVVIEAIDPNRHCLLEQVATVIDFQADRETGRQFAIQRLSGIQEELIADQRKAAVIGRACTAGQREREDVVEVRIDGRDGADQHRICRVGVLIDARRCHGDIGRTAIDLLDAEIDAGAVLIRRQHDGVSERLRGDRANGPRVRAARCLRADAGSTRRVRNRTAVQAGNHLRQSMDVDPQVRRSSVAHIVDFVVAIHDRLAGHADQRAELGRRETPANRLLSQLLSENNGTSDVRRGHAGATQRDCAAERIRRRDERSGGEDVQQLRAALREAGDVIRTRLEIGCEAEVPRPATIAVPDGTDGQRERIGRRIRDAGRVVVQAKRIAGR